MVRRKISRRKMEVELFPFLSILACTIGTLILLILVMTSQAIGNQKEVKIVAKSERGENQNKTPQYLECRDKQLIPKNQLVQKNSPLKKLLAQIKSKGKNQYLIIAVRPDAYDVFKAVRSMAELEKIDIGYEPLDRGWQLQVGK
jgi:biopolymer transport protein ExbD